MGARATKPRRGSLEGRARARGEASTATAARAAASDGSDSDEGPPPPPWVKRDDATVETEVNDPEAWINDALAGSAMGEELIRRCGVIAKKWADAMPKSTWLRITKSGRLVKEMRESAPVIVRTMAYVDAMAVPENRDEKCTIVDLCSGFGYLAMFLSELLPKEKVEEIVMVDKMWAMFGTEPKSHHINWAHVYGEGEWRYEWPIALSTRKVDLKDRAQVKQMANHLFSRWNGPFIVLGIHLCGILSIKAVEIFNRHSNVKQLILKPCCLPDFSWTYKEEYFEVGSHKHRIPTKEVCSRGKWKKNKWIGPPRHTLKVKFEAWNDHLCKSIDEEEGNVRSEVQEIKVQAKHFQNLFIFSEREVTRKCIAEEATGTRFPTPSGTEAGRWCPTGTGYGTHVKNSRQ